MADTQFAKIDPDAAAMLVVAVPLALWWIWHWWQWRAWCTWSGAAMPKPLIPSWAAALLFAAALVGPLAQASWPQ